MNANAGVSVALLTLNGGPLLQRLVEAVRTQKTERVVELVAIDSGSTDGTAERLREAGARVETIAPDEFNFGATRERLYTMCSGEFVVNLSQDAIPAHDRWLENLLAPFEDGRVAITVGPSRPDPVRGAQFPWERNGYFYFTREIRAFTRRHGRGVSFANSAVRRSVWEALHFEPQVLGEDFQFQIKAKAAGHVIAFPEGAAVLHHHDYTLGRLYRRCRDEGEALRVMGCGYNEWDLARDWASPGKWVQWTRELARGGLRSPASLLFPALRPWAVYVGSRFR